ncbi:AfsR/SARP family transcriptional regulator [Micromonospora endolithica]|nr:AfsR/SARP family transcriptional regulator [Micromonospora endolithica]TWJ25718.1 DNA-binding SARP family transcriptional activator [Micromonospora endolithica]
MRFGILGQLSVSIEDAGPLPLGAFKVRSLLATMLCQPNEPVSAAHLIDAVWEEDPPRSAQKNLHLYVHQLRRLLQGQRVVRHPHGYALTVLPGELDADAFQELAGRGRQAVGTGELDQGRHLLAEALRQWRGPAFADLTSLAALQETIARLTEERWTVLEERLEADLAVGAYASVTAELNALVVDNPLREGLRRLQMLALYRSGRQADALRSYREGRRILIEELGVDPSPALQRLERSILTADPDLDAAPPAVGTRLRNRHVPFQLPVDIRGFTGRTDQLARLDAALADASDDHPRAVVATAVGGAGTGKTTLAVHWAHRVAKRFPDGQLYLDLRGCQGPGAAMSAHEAVRRLLDGLEVPAEQIPGDLEAQIGLYRSLLAGRRVLIVLDDAVDTEQVRPLLPGAPGCMALITSRNHLTGLVASEGAVPIVLDVFTREEAERMLAARLGRAVVEVEGPAVDRLITASARLPLALGIVAARAANLRGPALARLADEMSDENRELNVPDTGDAEALAAQAGASTRSIGEMERGRRRSPRPRSVDQLADALKLTGDDRETFTQTGRTLFWARRANRPKPSGPGPRDDLPAAPDTGWTPLRHLPADLPDFVDRSDELAAIDAALDPVAAGRLVAVSGPPGIGKTALAVHAAHRFAPRFPDGQLFIRLGDVGGERPGPAEALARLLRAFGVDGSALPAGPDERAALLRTRLAGRRILLVVDDVGGHQDVASFLPDGGVGMVVTSRLPLTGLPGVTAVDLRPLAASAGVELISRVAGAERVGQDRVAAQRVVAMCGGLPLAVRIAAARLAARPHWTVATLAERLADEQARLDELRHGDLAVRPELHLAHQGLSPAAARAFALLGALGTGTFPQWVVAALLDSPPAAGATALEELLDARLLDSAGADQAGQSRFRFHEITRLYARECRTRQVTDDQWRAALSRVATGWLALARAAAAGLCCERFHLDDPTHPAAVDDPRAIAAATERPVDWFEAERESLTALVLSCAAEGLAATARCLAGCAVDFHELRAYYGDWHRVTSAALAACRRHGDRPGEAAMLRGLGGYQLEVDAPETAVATLRAAHTLALEVGDRAGAAQARKDVGYVLSLSGRLDEAERELRAAASELDSAGRQATRAMALSNLGFLLRQRGDTAGAVRSVRAGLEVARACADTFTEAYAWRGLAGALLAHGQAAEARQAARQAASLFFTVGDAVGAAQSLRTLGEALAPDPRRAGEAEDALATAAEVFRERGHAWGYALTELSLGEIEAARDRPGAVDRLRRALSYWTKESVPALRGRTLVALANAAERAGDVPAARESLTAALEIYRGMDSPLAAGIADRLRQPLAGNQPA